MKFFEKERTFDCTIYKILGIKIKIRNNNAEIRQMLDWKSQELYDRIIQGVERTISVARTHQETFAQFRNCHQNQSVALVGCGPTLNYFNVIPDVYYCGCNRAFLFDKIKFDYMFAIDAAGLIGMLDDFISYQGGGELHKIHRRPEH